MKLNAMFSNLNGSWIRWSDYRIAMVNNVNYIMPAETALSLPYSCTKDPEKMVADALNLGKAVFEENPDADEACLTFARRYGPLGVVATVRSPLLEAGRNADNSSRGVSSAYSGIFTMTFGEPLDRYQDTLRTLYAHFLLASGLADNQLSGKEQEQLRKQELAPESCGMSYRLTIGTPPQLIWEPDNLLAVLKLSYALSLSDPAAPLKVCKHCGKVYYNFNERSEFCSVKCRNHYNVIAFRERSKEKTEY